MLCDLYEDQSSCNEAAEVIMGRQRNIIDRFVHLLTCGSALMVVEKVIAMFKDGSLDVSLVRYASNFVAHMYANSNKAPFQETLICQGVQVT